ncbi:phosphohistidine phosphatase SixA [Lusitaniella coriacea LEGE 07157]|uniref:Phosphohistidine phosphatase SixA n=1 Tax=Lusitaniella coriacea LEGE 07157 TaxID=945747 RepID=A0A8J7B7N1_9CYAN|nr:phosphohistidine phosphatase SixA [Lusitaniella coriacea]MBE9115396.1 phosphohistidine phosphatase SixA [Lusitaniella coriacea LEGE 07157]
MELYLIRHGIAAERGTYENDDERPLIEVGRKKTHKVARRFSKIGVRFDVILTSPFLRARQTAQILKDAGLSTTIEECASLAPDGDLQTWVQGFPWDNPPRLALVGHQPDLGNWAELLVWGVAREKLILKKAGAIGLKLPETFNPVGQSELFLLTSPKWLL